MGLHVGWTLGWGKGFRIHKNFLAEVLCFRDQNGMEGSLNPGRGAEGSKLERGGSVLGQPRTLGHNVSGWKGWAQNRWKWSQGSRLKEVSMGKS